MRFGKPGKAGKEVRAPQAPLPSGPDSGTNVVAAAPFRFGVQPMAARTAAALFMATSLMSPMVRGRFRPGDKGNAVRRAVPGRSDGNADLGALQTFAGSYQGPGSAWLGAQSGPSSQPGFPSTNNDGTVDLSGLGMPDAWRVQL